MVSNFNETEPREDTNIYQIYQSCICYVPKHTQRVIIRDSGQGKYAIVSYN